MASGNKSRGKKLAVVEYLHRLSDTLLTKVRVKDVEKSSRTTVEVQSSSSSSSTDSGEKTLVIRGTRSQIRNALLLITAMTGEQKSLMEEAHRRWEKWVESAFPNLESQTYFLPPLHIKRFLLTGEIFLRQKIWIVPPKNVQKNCTAPVQMSDAADYLAFQRILFSLKTFSREQKDVFMCLSQYPFGSYLGEPEFAAAAASLPMPTNLPKEIPWEWRRGDFDLLIIHKQYGFVIFEMKAVGYSPDKSRKELDKQVTEKLIKAKQQLDKAEAILSHLVSDIAKGVRITKVIACPNLTTSEVDTIVFENQQLVKELCQCFKINENNHLKRHILCSNHLLPPDTPNPISDDILKELNLWWQELLAMSGADQMLHKCPKLYKALIARFCGPASTVTVPSITERRVSIKTWDQAVSLVGDLYTAHMILFPEQLELLSTPPPRVFIVGPPGTGKTVVLLLMAAEWLLQGHDVRILSTWDRSLAATFMLRHLLEEIIKTRREDESTAGRVHIVEIDLSDMKDAEKPLDELARADGDGPLFVIADEVGPDFQGSRHHFSNFCSELLKRFQNDGRELYFWAVSCQLHIDPGDLYCEKGWEKRFFKRPLRSPPSVTKEIEQAREITKDGEVSDYDKHGVPDYGEVPSVKWVFHRSRKHEVIRTEDCGICGGKVAKFLTRNLGLAGAFNPSSTETYSNGSRTLRYSDVLIISRVAIPEDSGFLKALSQRNIPVKVMKSSDIENVATARSNIVWATQQQLVRGLERKVVVAVDNYDDSKGLYVSTRLHAISRCSSQLVVVCPPPGYEPD